MIDSTGRTLTPCRRKVAEREVRLERAKWIGPQKIRLRFDPFAYRYVRLKVLERDGYICQWCGNPGDTMDHVIPWSKGGRTTMNNCICACQECNGRRGDMPPEQFAALAGVPLPQPGATARPLPVLVPPKPLPLPQPRTETRASVQPVPVPAPKSEPVPEPALAPAARRALSVLLDPFQHSLPIRSW